MRLAPDGRTVVCVREVHGEGEAENQIVALAARRLRRAGGARLRARLLLLPPGQPRRPLARLDLLGPPEHALGRDRALGRAAGGHGRRAPGRRRPRGVGLPARVGRRRAGCTSSPTATAGGTSTATRAGTAVAADRRGGRARPPAVAVRRLDLRLPRRRLDRLRPLRARRGTALRARPRRRAPARPRPPLHLVRLPLALGRGDDASPSPPPAPPARPRSSSTTSPAASWRRCAAPATSRSTPPTSRPRGRSSSRPAAARPPTASTTRRPTPSSRRRRASCRR